MKFTCTLLPISRKYIKFIFYAFIIFDSFFNSSRFETIFIYLMSKFDLMVYNQEEPRQLLNNKTFEQCRIVELQRKLLLLSL